MDVTAVTTPVGAWAPARPWVGLGARLILAGVFLFAGGSKIGDLAASGRAVNAYRVMPYGAATTVGAALPFIEVALAALLLVGLAPRLAALFSVGPPPRLAPPAPGPVFVRFIAGNSLVWARGLSIDCGCFGSGGQ